MKLEPLGGVITSLLTPVSMFPSPDVLKNMRPGSCIQKLVAHLMTSLAFSIVLAFWSLPEEGGLLRTCSATHDEANLQISGNESAFCCHVCDPPGMKCFTQADKMDYYIDY